jgi:hypothetical protein
MNEIEEFISLLPIDDEKYSMLVYEPGLSGFRLLHRFHGNVVLVKEKTNILYLNGATKSEIIEELNRLIGKKASL